ncbi:hypothetical protein NCCP2222_35030 [Sporosarcina sp. NCCP-2222]|uniref:hypothetical protein n=1 Tax=Sporosarcina sp. NCCP-2222 TaxID=2935073 RepID=UPI00207EB32A|nr:hypothetical protein [Sporosarcina sp. NCCP-2222]GKV57556.1 hypothetical protein NCCP2222_35030 [Sporosarcina sp. NCCP-2222]
MKKKIILFAVGILLGLLVSHWFHTRQKVSSPPVESPAPLELSSNVLTMAELEIPVKDLPTLQSYLSAQTDPELEIERTHYEEIETHTEERFFLLQYSCGNKQCDSLLIKVHNREIKSLPLRNGIFQDYQLSPDQDKVLIRYAYNEGGQIIRHILVPVDLAKLESIPFTFEEDTKEFMNEPTWPILEYEWISSNTFRLVTADLLSSDFNQLQTWYASDVKKSKTVDILLDE